jgi:hypothetical protein
VCRTQQSLSESVTRGEDLIVDPLRNKGVALAALLLREYEMKDVVTLVIASAPVLGHSLDRLERADNLLSAAIVALPRGGHRFVPAS